MPATAKIKPMKWDTFILLFLRLPAGHNVGFIIRETSGELLQN